MENSRYIGHPLNVASLLFLMLICYVGLQFEKHGGENRAIDHETLASGDSEAFIISASEHLPCPLIHDLRLKEVDFKDDNFILVTDYIHSSTGQAEFHDDVTPASVASRLYIIYVEYTGITNSCKQTSKVLDAIISGRYTIKVQLVTNGVETSVMTVRPEDYIPVWQAYGLKSKYYPEDK